MAPEINDQLQQLFKEQEPQKLFPRTVALVRTLDYEYVEVRLCLHIAALGKRVITYDNYPRAWKRQYEQQQFQAIDPVIAKCQETTLPVIWSDDLYKEAPELREAACRHGLIHGWSQSTHNISGNEIQISVSRRRSLDVNSSDDIALIMYLSHLLHERLTNHHLTLEMLGPSQGESSHKELLTPRQKEVLMSIAAGLTAKGIAKKHNIAVPTANFHTNQIKEKVGAKNKASIIELAHKLGLL
ncbi:autoinducer binding domain-containing protein [Pantoea sp. Cy-639]|uniref:helix-turn-helix transcriptional regulator n=1 Tax=Pantoea sp. Cy-639 TaxID=2608360 RepID=UPI00141FC2FC|nr:autoinducer binding domain-containing protein [Pantoea sp. Cy-639]NIF19431.1 LuxR family transcriptional regulator [Pantoea sp. Cy-639]